MAAVPLVRAIDRVGTSPFYNFTASMPIRSDATRTLSFSATLKDGRSSAAKRILCPNPAIVKRALGVSLADQSQLCAR